MVAHAMPHALMCHARMRDGEMPQARLRHNADFTSIHVFRAFMRHAGLRPARIGYARRKVREMQHARMRHAAFTPAPVRHARRSDDEILRARVMHEWFPARECFSNIPATSLPCHVALSQSETCRFAYRSGAFFLYLFSVIPAAAHDA